jgi:hypothetical protein
MFDKIIGWLNCITTGQMSVILLMLVVVDTTLALRVRIPKGEFLSKSLGIGMLLNSSLAFIPIVFRFIAYGMMIIQSKAMHNSPAIGDYDLIIFKAFAFVWSIVFGFGIIGSIITNLALIYPNTKILTSVIEKYLKKEFEKKGGSLDDINNQS